MQMKVMVVVSGDFFLVGLFIELSLGLCMSRLNVI